MRADLSRVETLLSGKTVKEHYSRRLELKYKLVKDGLKHVHEDLNQRLIAKSKKLQRYKNRSKQFVQNRMFETDQRRFYKELDGNSNNSQVTPDPEEAKQYWGGTWGGETTYEKAAEWLQRFEGGGGAPTAKQHMYPRGNSDAIPEESTKLESTRARPSAGFLVEEFHFFTYVYCKQPSVVFRYGHCS